MPTKRTRTGGSEEHAAVAASSRQANPSLAVSFIARIIGRRDYPMNHLDHLRDRVAKWWLPDEIVFIDEIRKTGTGKFDKKVIRDQYADLLME